ncbi:MAG TPA: ATP-binding protein [Thermoanaerobacterales bacterium]|nr:ATP-binding protein [Thermoanaerobacterales bacterium]
MKELSLHVLDIVQNSISAGASLIEIKICEDIKNDLMIIEIKDNGRGMDEHTLEKVKDPFFTTRTTRKVGLGIPLFEQAAKCCGGQLDIYSRIGVGTSIRASFIRSHIDRPPLGSMADTMVLLVAANPELDFIYRHRVDDREFVLDTREIKRTLQDVPVSNPMVLDWIKTFVEDNLEQINGGA